MRNEKLTNSDDCDYLPAQIGKKSHEIGRQEVHLYLLGTLRDCERDEAECRLLISLYVIVELMVGHVELISLILRLELEAILIEQGCEGNEVCPVSVIGLKVDSDSFSLSLDCLDL